MIAKSSERSSRSRPSVLRYAPPMRSLFALAFVTLATGCGNDPSYSEGPPVTIEQKCEVSKETSLAIASTRAIGAFAVPPTLITYSGGASAKIGDSVMWTFAEAVLTSSAIAGPRSLPSIFGFSSREDFLRPWIVTDKEGAPSELIPLTAEERDHNAKIPEDRFVVWPTGVIELAGEALVFYGRMKVGPSDLDIRGVDAGVAHVRKGDASARDRVVVFKPGEPSFGLGPLTHGDNTYAWACVEGGCVLGRAPTAKLTEHDAWQVYDGNAYVSTLTKGAKLITNAPGDLSMSWNPWVRKFVVLHSESFTDKVVLQTADKPEGPWSTPLLAFQTGGDQYAGKEHVALRSTCGDTLVATYFARTTAPPPSYSGELRAVEIKLK